MFKHNLKTLYAQAERSFLNTQTKFSKFQARSISEQLRNKTTGKQGSFMNNSRLFQSLYARSQTVFSRANARSSIFGQQFKRNFSSGGEGGSSAFERFLNMLLSKMPNGNIGWLVIGLNTLFYFLYLTWPRHQMYSYLNNFTFSKFNLMNGRLHTFLTCHFTHMSFLTYVLDSVILYLFC